MDINHTWQLTRQSVNASYNYARRLRNYILQIQAVIDKPFVIPTYLHRQIIELTHKALEGDGEALNALKDYPDRVRQLWYKEK